MIGYHAYDRIFVVKSASTPGESTVRAEIIRTLHNREYLAENVEANANVSMDRRPGKMKAERTTFHATISHLSSALYAEHFKLLSQTCCGYPWEGCVGSGFHAGQVSLECTNILHATSEYPFALQLPSDRPSVSSDNKIGITSRTSAFVFQLSAAFSIEGTCKPPSAGTQQS